MENMHRFDPCTFCYAFVLEFFGRHLGLRSQAIEIWVRVRVPPKAQLPQMLEEVYIILEK